MAAMQLRRAIAPVLAVWLSGLCCLLMCTAVCAEPAVVRGDCCARNAAIAAEEEACSGPAIAGEASPSESGCCFLTSRVATTATMPEAPAVAAAPAAVSAATVVFAVVDPDSPPPAAVPATSRGDTYLRCCVFLI